MPGIVPPNPADEARRQRMFSALAAIPPELREFIGQEYGKAQLTVLSLPYWSTVRFNAARTGAGPFTYTIAATPRKAFAYAQGQDMSIAGFTSTIATGAETNLLAQSQTRENSDVWIWGLSAYASQNSDPKLLGDLWRQTSLEISLNGTQSLPLGTFEMIPSAGGLYGAGQSALVQPPTDAAGSPDGGPGGDVGYVNNGNPMSGSFLKFAQPFKWSAIGSTGSDSSLVITCTPQRAIAFTAAARTAVPVVAMVSPATIEPYTPPADGTVFVDVRFQLKCVSISRRSANA